MHAPSLPQTDTIRILMGVHNGARHLPQQLDSIAAQDDPGWRLVVSDDGSQDNSRAVLDDFARRHPGRVTVTTGPQAGFSANFMALIADLPSDTGPVAFADQDDVWHSDKLSRARAALPDDVPALYCTRRLVWDPDSGRKTLSRGLRHPPAFENALVENIASGNTIVLNAAAAQAARQAAGRTGPVFAHDWWLYLLITGIGGRVIFDDHPSLLYRQHEANVLGEGRGLGQHLTRKHAVLGGTFRTRVAGNIAALETIADLLTPAARARLAQFAQARSGNALARLRALRDTGIYRQSPGGQCGLWGAVLLGKV